MRWSATGAGVLTIGSLLLCQQVTAQVNSVNYSPPLPSSDYPYPDSGAKIGQGWDSFNERATTSICVEAAEARLDTSSFETHVEQVQSTYSLVTKTTTSVSASYGGFGGGASGSVSTSSSLSVNSDDQNFLFTFASSNGSTFAIPKQATQTNIELTDQTIKGLSALKSDSLQNEYLAKRLDQASTSGTGSIRLTDEAEALRKANKRDFDRSCGDGFVSAVHRGSQIFLLLTQKYASTASANSLSASLSASGFGASGSASYSTSTQRLNSTNNLTYRIFQQGGVPAKAMAIPPVQANSFFDVNSILPTPDLLLANPTAFTVTITPYENVVRSAAESEFKSPVRLFTLGDYYLALKDEYKLVEGILTGVRTARSDKDFPFDNRIIDLYGGIKGLEELYDAIHFDLIFLEHAISQCYSQARACTVQQAVSQTLQDYATYQTNLETAETDSDTNIAKLSSQKTANKTSADITSQDIDTLKQRLAGIRSSLSRLKIQTPHLTEGRIDLEFFLRFYSYLLRTPLPKNAYSSSDFVALQELRFMTAVPGDREKQVSAANDALMRASFAFRLTPWKKFFCETLNSAPMCVPEETLHYIADRTLPGITGGQLTPIAPPPPPPPPSTPMPPSKWCGHGYIC